MNLNLEKKVETLGLVLAKKNFRVAPKMRVCAAIDISGSMSNEFADGDVQAAFDQCLGIAVKFDDDGDIQVWAFDTGSYRCPAANEHDYGTYIGTRRGQGKFGRWPGGGTQYSPVLRDIVKDQFPGAAPKGLFGFGAKKAPVGEPVMILFFTDGDTSSGDERDTEALIKKASEDRTNVYFNLIGVGNDSNFSFLRRMADKYDNCGFVHLHSLKRPDAEVYDELISDELVTFVNGQGVPA